MQIQWKGIRRLDAIVVLLRTRRRGRWEDACEFFVRLGIGNFVAASRIRRFFSRPTLTAQLVRNYYAECVHACVCVLEIQSADSGCMIVGMNGGYTLSVFFVVFW